MHLNFKSIPQNLKQIRDNKELTLEEVYNVLKNKIPMNKKILKEIFEGRVAPTMTQLCYILEALDESPDKILSINSCVKYKGKPANQEQFTKKFRFLVNRELEAGNYKNRERLSNDMGMISAALSNYFKGKTIPGPLNMIKICKFFKVTPEFFTHKFTKKYGDGIVLKKELCKLMANSPYCKFDNENTVAQYISRVLKTGNSHSGYVNINGVSVRRYRVSNQSNSDKGNKTDVFCLDDRFDLIDFINIAKVKSEETNDGDKKQLDLTTKHKEINNEKIDEDIELEEIVESHISSISEKIENNIRDIVESYMIYLEYKYRNKINSLKSNNGKVKIENLKTKITDLKNELNAKEVKVAELETKLENNKDKLSEIKNMLN